MKKKKVYIVTITETTYEKYEVTAFSNDEAVEKLEKLWENDKLPKPLGSGTSGRFFQSEGIKEV